MASKSVESAIRELSKLVCSYGDKISSLESKVSDLNVIICAQTQVINQLKNGETYPQNQCTCSASLAVQSPKADAAPVLQQRPVRQARLKAAAAKPNPSDYAGATKKTASNAAKPQASLSPSSGPTTPNVGRPYQTDAKNTTTTDCVAIKPVHPTDLLPIRSTLTTNLNETQNEWKYVSHKRPTKRRPIITGMGKEDDEIQTVEKMKYIQAWAFRPETTEQNILKYVNKIEQNPEYIVEKRDIKTDRFSSFIVGMPESLYERVCAPTSWPQGVRISEWFLARPRPARGNNNLPRPTARPSEPATESSVASASKH